MPPVLPFPSPPQIIKFGKVVRPIMGISFAPDQSGGRGWAGWGRATWRVRGQGCVVGQGLLDGGAGSREGEQAACTGSGQASRLPSCLAACHLGRQPHGLKGCYQTSGQAASPFLWVWTLALFVVSRAAADPPRAMSALTPPPAPRLPAALRLPAVEQLGVNGVLVLNARDGGPAAKAGIRGSSRDEYGRCVGRLLGTATRVFTKGPAPCSCRRNNVHAQLPKAPWRGETEDPSAAWLCTGWPPSCTLPGRSLPARRCGPPYWP